MKAILVFNKESNNSKSQVFPFLLFRKQLARRLGFRFVEHGVTHLSQIDVAKVNSYDVAFIQLKIQSADSNELRRLLERITTKKVLLDDYDGASKNAFKHMPFIDLYVKKQTLRAIADYATPYAHGQRHADIIMRHSGDGRAMPAGTEASAGAGTQAAPDAEKLVSGWGIGAEKSTYLLYRSRRGKGNLENKRGNAVSARFSLRDLGHDHWHNIHRELCRRQVLELGRSLKITVPSGRIDPVAYHGELGDSKISVSPWGFGEVCKKDFESVILGALLVKPDMGHVQTTPDIYVPYKTYVPVKPDFSDLREVCEYYLAHEDERLAIARAAFDAYGEYFEKEAFVEQMRDILTRLGLGESSRIVQVKNHRTGTFPMVYHETGRPKRNSPLMRMSAFIAQQPTQNMSCPDDLSIVTWNNYPDESLLERECRHLGIPLKVYGKDVPEWKSNYKSKKRLMYEACCRETATYIMGVDSRDLLFLASPSAILEEFKRTGAKMLFGGTINTSGFYSKARDLDAFMDGLPEARVSPFYNLNGGQWIAEREYAKRFFERTLSYPPRPEKPSSDQMILAHTLCHNPEFHGNVRIDSACRIFQIYTDASPITFFHRASTAPFYLLWSRVDATLCFVYRKLFRRIVAQADRCIGLVGTAIRLASPGLHQKLRRFLFGG